MSDAALDRFRVQAVWAKLKPIRAAYAVKLFECLASRPDLAAFFQSRRLFYVQENFHNHAKLVGGYVNNLVVSLHDPEQFERVLKEVCEPHWRLGITKDQFAYGRDCMVTTAAALCPDEDLTAWKDFCTYVISAMLEYASQMQEDLRDRREVARMSHEAKMETKSMAAPMSNIILQSCEIV